MKIVNVQPSNTYSGVSVSVFADYLKVSQSADQTIIQLALNAAVEYIEGLLWMKLANKTYTLIGSEWADGEYEIEITGTLGTVAVSYYNTSNVSTTLTLAADDYWLEQVDTQNSILHIEPDTFPDLYEREDAIRITVPITASTIPSAAIIMIYQIGAYFYDCRVNDKEPDLTVVEKMAMALRLKEF